MILTSLIQRWNVLAVAAVLLAGYAAAVRATDHGDLPHLSSGLEEPAADITGFFAFTLKSPMAPAGTANGKLVLMLCAYQDLKTKAEFPRHIEYVFRIRPADINPQAARKIRFGTKDQELSIVCKSNENGEMVFRFEGPDYPGLDSRTIPVPVDQKRSAEGVQVFAGRCADPFFSDFVRVRLPARLDIPGFNLSANWHVLALVVEIDLGLLENIVVPSVAVPDGVPSERTCLAMVAETRETVPGEPATRKVIDRMGRVEISPFLIGFQPIGNLKKGPNDGTNDRDGEAPKTRQQTWSEVDTFALANDGQKSNQRDKFMRWLKQGLERMDGQDGIRQWPDSGHLDAFVEILVDDVLLVDTRKFEQSGGSATDGYLDVELDALLGRSGRAAKHLWWPPAERGRH